MKSLFGLYLHECHRNKCKYRDKQTRDIFQYPMNIIVT